MDRRQAFERLYQRLDISFDPWLGESFYNPMLAGVVHDLQDRRIARPSEGEVCIFYNNDPHLAERPFLIQKSDGAFLYATTNLATIQYRGLGDSARLLSFHFSSNTWHHCAPCCPPRWAT